MNRDELIKACDELLSEWPDFPIGVSNGPISRNLKIAVALKQLLTQGVDGMSQKKAEKILEDDIRGDWGLYCLGRYLAWSPGDKNATLDAEFSADELEAIAWWMRNRSLQAEGKG